MLVAIAAAVGLIAWSSCASPRASTPPNTGIAIPSVWRGETMANGTLDVASLPTWWTRFNDPVLDELIVTALRSSPDVRSALSRIAEYRARRGVERAALFPSLDANLSGGRTRTTNRDQDTTTTRDAFSASLDASWQVDLFGRQRSVLAAASADLAQTEADYHGAQVSLAAEVATAYVTLRSAEARLAVVVSSLGTRAETARLTRLSEQSGTGGALDTQQSLAELELARASIPDLQLTIAQTRNQLALLCGGVPGSLDPLLAAPKDVPAAPAELAVGIPAEVLRQRPDVRAAEHGLEAAFARTSAARRARLPALNLGGSIGVEALEAGRLFNPASTVVSILGGLTAPIFDAGRISRTITIQRELENQALDTYASTVLVALGEVENALIAVRRNTERLDLLVRATAAAREAAALAALQ